MITLGQLVKFILANRKGKAFKDYSEQTIAFQLIEASRNNALLYDVNEVGNPCGIIVCERDDTNKILHVHDILITDSRRTLGKFIRYFKQHLPDYTLSEQKKDQRVLVKTDKLCRRILLQDMKGAV